MKTRMTTRSRKRGFSLGEILVAVAIMAVIAAVVIPSIGSQLNKGETGRVSNDLINIRSAAEQFLADVRRYPAAMVQLNTKPLALTPATDTGLVGGQFSSAQVNRWKGPYATKDGTLGLVTGYGVSISAEFLGHLISTQKYVTIVIVGLDTVEALDIDRAMDDGVVNTGQIRWSSVGTDSLKYFALPVQQ